MLPVAGVLAASSCLPPAKTMGETDDGGAADSAGEESSTIGPTGTGTTSGGATESTGDGNTTAPEGRDNGARCDQHDECASDRCFYIPLLGGLCSECLIDADCDGRGCSLPGVLDSPPRPARCTDGALGEGCMSDAVCQEPLVCAQILDVPTVIESSTCGECHVDADCGANLCAPRYHIREIRGEWVCVEPGSVPNGEGCALDGSGDAACASGICAPANIQGLTQVGICGDCASDADCTPPQVCQETGVTLLTGTVHPAICVD
jgi:hypothetical protein